MIKQQTYNIADTNIALLGSDIERKVKEAAAATESAWAGLKENPTVGIKVWRIEKFKVVEWDKEDYGTFYDGDSYIVLETYKEGNAFRYNVHVWLGEHTTPDEAGTACYKMVELDTHLGDLPKQHRQVQGHESEQFLKYWAHPGIEYLKGGVESGFNHVPPEEYRHRLLHIKGHKNPKIIEVDAKPSSLNSGDCFILDCGLILYQFNGAKSGIFEKNKAAEVIQAIDDHRGGKPEKVILDEGDADSRSENSPFWTELGGKADIKSAEEGGSDHEPSDAKRLFKLSDQSGNMEFTECSDVNASALDTADVFVFDSGAEVFVWVGKGASTTEKSTALQAALDYLHKFSRPSYLPITRVMEGGHNPVFAAQLSN